MKKTMNNWKIIRVSEWKWTLMKIAECSPSHELGIENWATESDNSGDHSSREQQSALNGWMLEWQLDCLRGRSEMDGLIAYVLQGTYGLCQKSINQITLTLATQVCGKFNWKLHQESNTNKTSNTYESNRRKRNSREHPPKKLNIYKCKLNKCQCK